ncbi:MAG: SGNH/GDSL hydrolase family protein, partial [Cyanobacteria bacterium P01_A01_bin.105]
TGLFVIWAGANDYTEFFADPTVSAGRSPADIPQEATDNIIGSIVNLAQLGAKNILVPNLPPIGLLPFADILDAALPQQDIPTLLSHLSAAHNQLLAAKLDGVEAQFNDVNLIELDIDGLVAEIIANPTAFGFSNVETPCLTILQNGGFCNPDEFLFWDETHPTEATHSYVAELALTALDDRKASEPASTPEPGMAVATLMAFGLTGLWRRQRVSSVDVDKLVA